MSKRANILFSILFSAIFLFSGTGYNLFIYCCDMCAKAGVETMASTSCECIHSHHHHKNGEIHLDHDKNLVYHTCDFADQHKKGCEFKRLSVDTPVMHHADVSFVCPAFDFLDFAAYHISKLPEETFSSQYLLTDFPSLYSGREILSRTSVLLI